VGAVLARMLHFMNQCSSVVDEISIVQPRGPKERGFGNKVHVVVYGDCTVHFQFLFSYIVMHSEVLRRKVVAVYWIQEERLIFEL